MCEYENNYLNYCKFVQKRLKYKYETPKLFGGFHKKTREAEL